MRRKDEDLRALEARVKNACSYCVHFWLVWPINQCNVHTLIHVDNQPNTNTWTKTARFLLAVH